MTEPILLYIGTSKIKEIRMGQSVTFDWGTYGNWTKFKSPAASSTKKVKYNKNTKNAVGSSKYGNTGGRTVLGTTIPATVTRVIDGVPRTCNVRYFQRGYTIYQRPNDLKKKKQMKKITYTKDKPYQYMLQYQDKAIKVAEYSRYEDGIDYIYFWDYYYNTSGNRVNVTGHLPHPTTFNVSYSDVMKNFDTSNTNNNDGRDNHGSLVMSNVRANLVTIEAAWEGLSGEEGADLLETLNPSKDSKGQYNYLIVQYMDPATNKVANKTFYASERKAERYASGYFKSISVTLTEV